MYENNLMVICNNYPDKDNLYIGGIFVKEQIKYLKKYFNNVYVICPVAYGIERLRKTTYQNYQYDNVKIYFPKYLNFPLFYSYVRWLWISLEVKAILSLIKRENITFDLIHAHFTWPSGAVATELKKTFLVPVIITEGGSTILYEELLRMNRYYIDTYLKCDAIIRNNKSDIPLFIKCGIEVDKIHNVQYGYDQKKFFPIPQNEARNLLGIEPQKKIILNIGRLSEEKGQKFLIESMVYIVRKNPDIICYIGGTGPSNKTLRKQIVALHLDNNIKMIGFVLDAIMPLWINAADLFVLPSLNEGNPTIMFEVLGCGKPFMGTNVGGVPEIITSDNYGLLVESGDANDLAEKIMMALDRQWDREVILQYADPFRLERIAKEIIIIYKKAGLKIDHN